jgi:hypothetical protein
MSIRNCAECGKPITRVYRSRYFCYPCDVERIARIDASFKQIEEDFNRRMERARKDDRGR